ncbi:DUF2946 domain-containing protein [Frateuria sp.]|uniref:DUF2946 domain-containing protein n=1 Tax=Frateuria sp. TaxID=2211372 RepID=UPI0039C86198
MAGLNDRVTGLSIGLHPRGTLSRALDGVCYDDLSPRAGLPAWRRELGRSGAHRRVVAWLAFTAVWLTLFSPVISRVLPSLSGAAMSGMACSGLTEHATGQPTPHPHLPAPDKCGYCTLLGHSPALGTAAWVPALLPHSTNLPASVPNESHIGRHSPLAPTPRGPPESTNA